MQLSLFLNNQIVYEVNSVTDIVAYVHL